MPTITDHFLNMVIDQMCLEIHEPKFVEGDFSPLMKDLGMTRLLFQLSDISLYSFFSFGISRYGR
jgi:hypothetical protein